MVVFMSTVALAIMVGADMIVYRILIRPVGNMVHGQEMRTAFVTLVGMDLFARIKVNERFVRNMEYGMKLPVISMVVFVSVTPVIAVRIARRQIDFASALKRRGQTRLYNILSSYRVPNRGKIDFNCDCSSESRKKD